MQWYRHKYTSSHHRRAWRERCRKFVSCIYAATLQKATLGRDTFPFKNFPCCRACMGSLPPGNCLTSHLERTTEPRSGQFRPGQPTTGQTCSWKVPAVTTSALPHNATKIQGSCPQRSGEALELSQGRLEALLPSHRWIRREIATSNTPDIERAYQDFCESLLSAAKQYIPRGRRKNYVPCSDKECETLYRSFIRTPSGDCLWQSRARPYSLDYNRRSRSDGRKLSTPSTSRTPATENHQQTYWQVWTLLLRVPRLGKFHRLAIGEERGTQD